MSTSSFKYKGSYEDIALIIRKYVAAFPVELEKLFTLVLFNYLFSNGDAHLKNFTLIDTEHGDYILSPAYDLICTRLHVNDTYFSLKDGLFSGDYETESFKENGFYSYQDFYKFGQRIGLKENRIRKALETYSKDHAAGHVLIGRSFLREDIKEAYRAYFMERLKMIGYAS